MQRVGGAHLRVIAPGQHSFFRRNVAVLASRWQSMFHLTGPRLEPQTSRSRDERVSARPTGRSLQVKLFVYHYAITNPKYQILRRQNHALHLIQIQTRRINYYPLEFN